MKEIKLIRSENGDWERMVVDDKVIMEGHSLNSLDILEWFGDKLDIKVVQEWKDEDYF